MSERDRLTSVEVKVDNLEDNLREHEQLNRESFDAIGKRIDKFMNNEVHHLQAQIDTIKTHKGVPLTRTEWIKLLVTCIGVSGTIVVALIQYGVIGS